MRSHDTKTDFKIDRPWDINYGTTILTWDSFTLVKKDIMLCYNPASVFLRAWFSPSFIHSYQTIFSSMGALVKEGGRTRRPTAL